MRKLIFPTILLLGLGTYAKEIKIAVFTPQPQMVCENCEATIKNGLKFEKGVKKITTDIPEQTVVIRYDSDTTNPEKLAEAFQKINYNVELLKDSVEVQAKKK